MPTFADLAKEAVARNNALSLASMANYPMWIHRQVVPSLDGQVFIRIPDAAHEFVLELIIIRWDDQTRLQVEYNADSTGLKHFDQPGDPRNFTTPVIDTDPATAGVQGQFLGARYVGDKYRGREFVQLSFTGIQAGPTPATIEVLLKGRAFNRKLAMQLGLPMKPDPVRDEIT